SLTVSWTNKHDEPQPSPVDTIFRLYIIYRRWLTFYHSSLLTLQGLFQNPVGFEKDPGKNGKPAFSFKSKGCFFKIDSLKKFLR
ncbi:MAG: hypothetical protein LBP71_00985, partial [Spirochaetaceae bacterium]|nr:hypothetical protein [Spirochaetaceae bacterium]